MTQTISVNNQGIEQEAPLSVSLRECTSMAHEHAEESPFMSRLLEGTLSTAAVADYTGQLWFVYRVLEQGVRDNAGQTYLRELADSRLERLPAIEADLDELIGPGWREELVAGAATRAYVGHLETLAASHDQLGLLAHHYTRYLGDLSGGQIIARMLQKRYGISSRGVNFYDFGGLGKIKPYRDTYRDCLDSLALEPGARSWLIAEANQAFACNGAVFQELAEKYC